MEFKYALSLLFSNMGYVLKIFVWVLIAMIVTVCIGAAIIVPVIDAFGEVAEVAAAYGEFTAEVSAFVDSDISIRGFLESIPSAFGGLVTAVASQGGLLAALIICLIFLYALYSFLVSFSYYPTAYIIGQLMSSNMRMGLAASMALNFKQSVRFAACRVSVAVPIDVCLVTLACLLFWGLFTAIGVFSLPIMLLLGVVVVALRHRVRAQSARRQAQHQGVDEGVHHHLLCGVRTDGRVLAAHLRTGAHRGAFHQLLPVQDDRTRRLL